MTIVCCKISIHSKVVMGVLNLFTLQGKTALVTGCNKGIGKAISVVLAGAGADIVGVSGSLALTGSEVEQEVTSLGKNFYAYQADFSRRDDLYRFIRQVQNNHPVIDILVNNAGIILREPAISHTDEMWDQVLNINLNAPFILSRELAKPMLSRKNGKIIFICSLLSFQGGINVPGYAAAKAGLTSLIKALANEWAAAGVHVNGIAPGYIATDNTTALRNNEERNNAILSRIPAGRWGTPDDIAGAALFLASAASNYIDGTIITVDGGWMGR